MKLTVRVTLTGQPPTTLVCGPRALSAAEKNFSVKVASDGLSIEHLAFAAWAQAGIDGQEPGSWPEWWKRVDDLEVVPAVDPTGPGTGPLPESSSDSASEPESPSSP